MPKKNKAIYEQWERLVFQTPRQNGLRPPSAEIEWKAMWDNHISGPKLAETHIDDSVLICTLGWTFAVQRQDYEAARSRIERWFEHPDVQSANSVDMDWCRCVRAAAYLLSGAESEALSQYRAILDEASPKTSKGTLFSVRNDLYQFSAEQSVGSTASPEFSLFVQDVIAQFRGKKRLSRSIDPTQASYANLASALGKTYPTETDSEPKR